MNDDVRMPIVTTREGNKITKVCVEDVYKIINRVIDSMDRSYNNSIDIIDSIYKEVDDYEGDLIVGTGISQPCSSDKFDEKIGNNIAFMKAKLNANIKKKNILNRIYKQYKSTLKSIEKEINTIDFYIDYDLDGIRKYNPDYLIDYEKK
jgi:hypothetical protein